MQNLEAIYESTVKVIDIAINRALELNIKDFVIASCTGKTIEIFFNRLENFKKSFLLELTSKDKSENISSNFNIVCVTHQVGFTNPNHDEMPQLTREKLTGMGVKILTTTHLLGGIDRALRFQFKGVYPAEIVSASLRMFGQGIKVCTEISVMATDAGLVKSYQDIIALGGTGFGADTAAVICPAHSQSFFNTKIKEIILKPCS